MTGIKLTGELNGWATPKDLILHVAGKLTVRVRYAFMTISHRLTFHRVALVVFWSTLALVYSTSHALVLQLSQTWAPRLARLHRHSRIHLACGHTLQQQVVLQ